jgi:ABC-2 type transport system permease protein
MKPEGRSMKAYVKYQRSFIIGLQNAMEYRVNFLISLLGIAIPLVMQLYLWTAIFSNSSSDKVYGYSFQEMIIYVVLAGLLSKLVATGFEGNMAEEIKNGGLSKFLIKPIGYFQYRICCFLGEKSVHMAMMTAIIGIVLILLNIIYGLVITVQGILFFAIAVIFAICINFLLFYMLGLTAFYMSEVWGILYGANLAVTLVSGGILPLETFGSTILKIFALLPFKYIVYFPITIISGRLSTGEILRGFGFQILWIGLLAVAAKLVWKNGLKKYIAAGG